MATSGSINFSDSRTSNSASWSAKSSDAGSNTYSISLSATVKATRSILYTYVIFEVISGSYRIESATGVEKDIGSMSSGSTKTVSTTCVVTGTDVTGGSSGFNGSIRVRVGYAASGSDMICDGTLAISGLPALARYSIPTLPSAITLGEDFAVTTNRKNSSFTHTIQLSAGTGNDITIASNVGASKSDLNAAVATWAPYILNTSAAAGKIRVITYSGNTSLGYVDRDVTVIIPNTCAPAITNITASDTNGYLSRFGKYLSSASLLHLSWSESESYNSPIVTRSVYNGENKLATINESGTGCDVYLSGISGNNQEITAEITDARGQSARQSVTISVIEYESPRAQGMTMYRSDSSGVSSAEGDRVSFNIPWEKSSIPGGSSVEQNFVTLQVYSVVGGARTLLYTSGSAQSDAISGTTVTLQGTYSNQSSFDFLVILTDTTGLSSEYPVFIPTASRPLSVKKFLISGVKKWGMAIGRVARTADQLEVAIPTRFNGAVQFDKKASETTITDETGTFKNLVDLFMPVGTIYETRKSQAQFDPNLVWGGTWNLVKGRVLIGAGENDANTVTTHGSMASGVLNVSLGDKGGEPAHLLSGGESGTTAHGHSFTNPTVNGGSGTITGGGHSHATVTNGHRFMVYNWSDISTGITEGTVQTSSSGNVKVPKVSSSCEVDYQGNDNTGSATHSHSLPAHTHTVSGGSVSSASETDASNSHNNMMPYYGVNIWERVA